MRLGQPHTHKLKDGESYDEQLQQEHNEKGQHLRRCDVVADSTKIPLRIEGTGKVQQDSKAIFAIADADGNTITAVDIEHEGVVLHADASYNVTVAYQTAVKGKNFRFESRTGDKEALGGSQRGEVGWLEDHSRYSIALHIDMHSFIEIYLQARLPSLHTYTRDLQVQAEGRQCSHHISAACCCCKHHTLYRFMQFVFWL
jgi:hypothetical protein